jgi:HEAT repeat protein
MALGELEDTTAVEPLISAVSDANADVRRRAVTPRGENGDTRALPALTKAVKDEDATVRRYAIIALAGMTGEN